MNCLETFLSFGFFSELTQIISFHFKFYYMFLFFKPLSLVISFIIIKISSYFDIFYILKISSKTTSIFLNIYRVFLIKCNFCFHDTTYINYHYIFIVIIKEEIFAFFLSLQLPQTGIISKILKELNINKILKYICFHYIR